MPVKCIYTLEIKFLPKKMSSGWKWLPQLLLLPIIALVAAGVPPSDANSNVTKFEALIAKEISKIPLLEFKTDPILKQSVDRINKISSYRDAGVDEKSPALYTHNENDAKKEVIVFPADKNVSDSNTLRYLYLRRTTSKEYFAGFAYIRQADSQDSPTFPAAGIEIAIEYEPFDLRDDDLDHSKSLGWTDCRATIYVPCKSLESEKLKALANYKPVVSSDASTPNVSITAKAAPSKIKILPVPGTEPDLVSPSFFLDLEDDAMAARTVGQNVKIKVKGSITSTTVTGYGEIIQHLKSGDVSLDQLSPEIISALMETYGNETVAGGMTIQSVAKNITYQKVGAGEEVFISNEYEVLIDDVDSGDDMDLLFEVEAKPLPKPAKGKQSATTENPNIIPVQGGGNNTFIINVVNTIVDGFNNFVSGVSQAVSDAFGGKGEAARLGSANGSGGKGGGKGDAGGSGGKGGGKGDKEPWWKILSEQFTLKVNSTDWWNMVKDQAAKQCPSGKKCKVKVKKPVGGEDGSDSKAGAGGSGGTWEPNGGASSPQNGYGTGWGAPSTKLGGILAPRAPIVGTIAGGTIYAGVFPQGEYVLGYVQVTCQPRGFLADILGEPLCVPGTYAVVAKLGRSIPPGSIKGSNLGRSVGAGITDAHELTNVDYMTHPGWKPLFDNVTDKISLQAENEPYIGFGYCQYNPQSPKALEVATSGAEVTRFFLNALRVGCLSQEMASLHSIYDLDCLALRADKSFEVPSGCKYLNKEKLTQMETHQFSRAFELAAFSQEYVVELRSPTHAVTPDGNQISRSVYLLGKIAFHTISESRLRARHHIVKLTRNLIKSLKTAFTKSIQDLDKIYNRCGVKCKVDLQVNENDRLYLLSLIEFIIRGVGTKTSQNDMQELFKDFYGQNKESILGRLNDYIV